MKNTEFRRDVNFTKGFFEEYPAKSINIEFDSKEKTFCHLDDEHIVDRDIEEMIERLVFHNIISVECYEKLKEAILKTVWTNGARRIDNTFKHKEVAYYGPQYPTMVEYKITFKYLRKGEFDDGLPMEYSSACFIIEEQEERM